MKRIKIGQIGVCHEHAAGKIQALRLRPDVFELVGVVDDRASAAAKFAGSDLKTVYITDPGSKALYRMRSDVPGLKLFCSPGSASTMLSAPLSPTLNIADARSTGSPARFARPRPIACVPICKGRAAPVGTGARSRSGFDAIAMSVP